MHGAQEPAERDLVVEILQNIPGLCRRRGIDQRQQDARDDLQNEQHKRCRAEDIPPTGSALGHVMKGGFFDERFKLHTPFKPVVGAPVPGSRVGSRPI